MEKVKDKNKFYNDFLVRNLGFVNEQEQELLSNTKVFVCGVGGMGGACLESLIRMGIKDIGVCDIDTFEVSNLNRQVFCNMDSVDQKKSEASVEQSLKINPFLNIKNWAESWADHIDEICEYYDIIVNGCDDVKSTLLMYRKARVYKIPVVDAFASPLPSVYVTRPGEPTPEEWLKYPSLGVNLDKLTDDILQGCFQKELEHVIANTSSEEHIHMKYAIELFEGKRGRMSLAPMVILTGNLMAYEVYYMAIKKTSATTYRGYFLNTKLNKIEKKNNFIIQFLKRRFLKKL